MHSHLDMVFLEGRRNKKTKNLLTLGLVLHHQFFRRLGQFEQLCILSFNASGFYRPKDFPLQHLVVLLDCAGSGALSHVGDWCVVLSVTNQSHTHSSSSYVAGKKVESREVWLGYATELHDKSECRARATCWDVILR